VAARLVNAATADGYTTAATVVSSRRTRLVGSLNVSNAAVYYQLARTSPDDWDPDEAYLLPVVGSLDRQVFGIRFRSAAAGVPARVSCELVT